MTDEELERIEEFEESNPLLVEVEERINLGQYSHRVIKLSVQVPLAGPLHKVAMEAIDDVMNKLVPVAWEHARGLEREYGERAVERHSEPDVHIASPPQAPQPASSAPPPPPAPPQGKNFVATKLMNWGSGTGKNGPWESFDLVSEDEREKVRVFNWNWGDFDGISGLEPVAGWSRANPKTGQQIPYNLPIPIRVYTVQNGKYTNYDRMELA